jgi:HSP20 family protein
MENKENQTKAENSKNELTQERPFGFLDPLFGAFFPEERGGSRFMKTDVKENDNGYELAVEVPGLKRDQISVTLDDGYLTIAAKENNSSDTSSKNGKFIRRERFVGSYERSFYVGDIEQKDINAKLENGILNVTFPKESSTKKSANSINIQ